MLIKWFFYDFEWMLLQKLKNLRNLFQIDLQLLYKIPLNNL